MVGPRFRVLQAARVELRAQGQAYPCQTWCLGLPFCLLKAGVWCEAGLPHCSCGQPIWWSLPWALWWQDCVRPASVLGTQLRAVMRLLRQVPQGHAEPQNSTFALLGDHTGVCVEDGELHMCPGSWVLHVLCHVPLVPLWALDPSSA